MKSTPKIENLHPMKNIIVPLDFSVDSLKGLDLAIVFARKIPVKIQLVYVQRRHDVPSVEEEEYHQAEKKFIKLIDKYDSHLHEGSQINYIIKKGKVYQEVVSQAEAFPDSLIIASTHGASGFEELFIGSNAFRIVSATSRPVITIRQAPVPQQITNIILPIDNNLVTRQKVVFSSLIAKIFNATVHVVIVSNTKNKKIINRLNAYSEQVIDYLMNKDIAFKTESIISSDVFDDLFSYTIDQKAELISIMNETGTSITDLIIGSLAQQMISKSPVPVLTIRAKPRTIKDSFSTFGG